MISPVSRTELVIEQIKNWIQAGEFREGDTLPPEKKLCEMLGVSRTVLREAVSVLSSQGILDVRQGSGTMVRKPTMEDSLKPISNFLELRDVTASQVMEVRLALETAIARIAAERCCPSKLESLKKTVEVMRDPATNISVSIQKDDEFHIILAEATENELFVLMTRSIANIVNASRRLKITANGLENVVREHTLIINAIEQKDSDASAKTMETHLRASHDRFPKDIAIDGSLDLFRQARRQENQENNKKRR